MKPTKGTSSDNERCGEIRTDGTQASPQDLTSFEAIKQHAGELMAECHVPGLAIGVISGGSIRNLVCEPG